MTFAGKTMLAIAAAAICPQLLAGTSVFSGSAVLDQATRATLSKNDPTEARFSATANSAVLDWSKFNLPQGHTLGFDGRGTTFFNLVSATAGKSQIDGIINGNGSVWVINPSGIAFGANSSVNVGGFFAAAAGNLSNEAALRDGTALTPAFSSFAERVDVDGGAKFTADQVAMLGKGVSVSGDFTGVKNLTVGSAGKLVVDEVEGGRISVHLEDFAYDEDSSAGFWSMVVGGDLAVASAGDVCFAGATMVEDVGVEAAGALTMVSDGMDVAGTLSGRVDGEAVVFVDNGLTVGDFSAGDVSFMASSTDGSTGDLVIGGTLRVEDGWVSLGTGNGSIVVTEKGEVSARSVMLTSAEHDGANGDVIVRGRVSATDDGQCVYAGAAFGEGAHGDVLVSGLIEAVEGDINLETVGSEGAASGNVIVSGTLRTDGDISLSAYAGSVIVNKGARIDAAGEDSLVVLESSVCNLTAGDVSVEGEVSACGNDGSVCIKTGNGSVTVGPDAKVSAPLVQILGSECAGGTGDVTIDGTVEATGEWGYAYIASATGDGSSGDVRVSGRVISESGDVDLEAGTGEGSTGDITISGTVSARGNGPIGIQFASLSGNVTIEGAGRVEATGEDAEIRVLSAIREGTDGDVVIDGTVTALGEKSTVGLAAGESEGASGSVSVGGSIRATGRPVMKDGKVMGDGVSIVTRSGDVHIEKGASIEVSGEGGWITLGGATRGEGGKSDIAIDGTLKATGENGRIFVSVGDENPTATGSVIVNGTLFAQGAQSRSVDETTRWEIQLSTTDGNIAVGREASIESAGVGGVMIAAGSLEKTSGNIEMAGSIRAEKAKAAVDLEAGYGDALAGDVRLSGNILAGGGDFGVQLAALEGNVTVTESGSIEATDVAATVRVVSSVNPLSTGDVRMDGRIAAAGEDATVYVTSSLGILSQGDVSVGGTISAGKGAYVNASYGAEAKGSATVSGSVTAGDEVNVVTGDGHVRVDGRLAATEADSVTTLAAGRHEDASGDIVFGAEGQARAKVDVNLYAPNGRVWQEGSQMSPSVDGTMESRLLSAAAAAENVNFLVDGDVGGESGYFAVNGKAFGAVSGDAFLAAADGSHFMGGSKSDRPDVLTVSEVNFRFGDDFDTTGSETGRIKLLDWSGTDENSSVVAGRELGVYTQGSLNPYGLLQADGDITVSAASFGDLSYLRAGGTLHVNNVGRPANPLLAYFETVNGVTPKIDNQPNDTVIFVDGRLAGGNIQTMNRLGSHEAFPVETPELKSVQGVFGNPNFLHGELDVSEPVGIGVIDYLLVDRARMSYGADIPPEMDMQVSVNGLSPLYSYWFGQSMARNLEMERKPNRDVSQINPH